MHGKKTAQGNEKGHLEITPLNEQFEHMSESMLLATMDESLQKAEEKKLNKAKKKQAALAKKEEKKAEKEAAKMAKTDDGAAEPATVKAKSRVFVLNFRRQYQCIGGQPSSRRSHGHINSGHQ